MKFIDLHCDTLLHLNTNSTDTLLQNKFSVDFKRMKDSGCLAQFFAIFPLPQEGLAEPYFKGIHQEMVGTFIEEKFTIFYRDIAKSDNVNLALNVKDVVQNEKEGKSSAFLSIENGLQIKGNLNVLYDYYIKGVRLITLVWNSKNSLGSPCSKNSNIMKEGLSTLGKKVIEEMNSLGMIIDVSHLSDGGFWDVVNISKKPFIASHSNCRDLVPNPRNLSNDMIKKLSDLGGVIGLNFEPTFLNQNTKDTHSTINAIIHNAKHMRKYGGIDVIAIGSDLDGTSGTLEIDSTHKIPNLLEALAKNGFTYNEIDKISKNNVLRVMRDVFDY